MRFLLVALSLFLAACTPDEDPYEAMKARLERRKVTEANIAKVVEVARELQHGMMFIAPAEFQVFEAVRVKYSHEVLRDGWGRPLRYQAFQRVEGRKLHNGFEVISDGENGIPGDRDDNKGGSSIIQTMN